MNKHFLKGLRDGIPIFLGYLSVSFGFGILAVDLGLSVLQAVVISVTNLTSAGQVAGVQIIAAAGGAIEMALTQLVLNVRYSLMGLSLSQKLDKSFNTLHRMIASFGITDEIFAVSYAQEGRVKPAYMYGLILISAVGWTLGTLLGAAAGEILPASITTALGILVYGMFLAIIIPPARKSRGVLLAVVIGAAISVIIRYCIPAISGGFSIIISAVLAAAICAAVFPAAEDADEEGGDAA